MFAQIFILACVMHQILSKELPSFVKICHKNDPEVSKCVINSIDALRPYLASGVPEFNIPSLEPLVLQDLFSEDAAGMKIYTRNVSAYGCTTFDMHTLELDLENHVYTASLTIPQLHILAEYTVDGRLLVVPVKGNGDLEVNVTNIDAVYVLRGELFDKDGETFVRYISADLKVKVLGGGHIRLEHLFNSDKILLGIVNDALNKNLDSFIKELMPIIEKALARNILNIANKIVDGYTVSQLIPA